MQRRAGDGPAPPPKQHGTTAYILAHSCPFCIPAHKKCRQAGRDSIGHCWNMCVVRCGIFFQVFLRPTCMDRRRTS